MTLKAQRDEAIRQRDELRAELEKAVRVTEVDIVGADEIAAEAERQGALEALAYWRGRRHGLRIGIERLNRLLGRDRAPVPPEGHE